MFWTASSNRPQADRAPICGGFSCSCRRRVAEKRGTAGKRASRGCAIGVLSLSSSTETIPTRRVPIRRLAVPPSRRFSCSSSRLSSSRRFSRSRRFSHRQPCSVGSRRRAVGGWQCGSLGGRRAVIGPDGDASRERAGVADGQAAGVTKQSAWSSVR